MSIADDLAATIAEGRKAAEELMVDACDIRPPTGRATGDDGKVTDTLGDPIYDGKCKFQLDHVDAALPEVGASVSTVLRGRIDVPMRVTGVTTDHVITIKRSRYDPSLVGKTFRVVAPFHGSLKTARRIPVEETVTTP